MKTRAGAMNVRKHFRGFARLRSEQADDRLGAGINRQSWSISAGQGSTLSRAEIKIIESDSGRVMPPEREAEIDW